MSVACRDMATSEVCYTDPAGGRSTLVAHYEYRANAAGRTVVHAVRYTTAAGLPVDTTPGLGVVVGACPVYPPDVEWEQLCDTLPGGTVVPFWQRLVTVFDTNGVAITPSAQELFGLDKVTPYAPVGVVGVCDSSCLPVAPVGLVTTWG